MGKGCITATKYFLFLFNLIFFLFGALIMGFGLWVLLDNQSFIAVLQEKSSTLKVGAYMLIGVGSLTMLMGFLGCMGAIYEVRCLLGLYFTCLLLILIAQVTAAALIYFQQDLLKKEMSSIVKHIIVKYTGQNETADLAWDYLQSSIQCCGWTEPQDWGQNEAIRNSSTSMIACSCRQTNSTASSEDLQIHGLCESAVVYSKGCMTSVEDWILNNCGVILGVCIAVAVVELLGMILSMCLCKSVHQEDYTKVPRY